jgi:hypothetical protein
LSLSKAMVDTGNKPNSLILPFAYSTNLLTGFG